MSDTSNPDKRLVARIDKWLAAPGPKARYGPDDEKVLRYIRNQLSRPRPEDYTNVQGLHDAARARLAPYK